MLRVALSTMTNHHAHAHASSDRDVCRNIDACVQLRKVRAASSMTPCTSSFDARPNCAVVEFQLFYELQILLFILWRREAFYPCHFNVVIIVINTFGGEFKRS